MRVPHSKTTLSAAMAVSLAFVVNSCAAAVTPAQQPAAPSTETVDESRLRQHVEFLASDELGSRHSFDPGSRIAARYLAEALRSYGYRGGAPDGSFLQPIPLDSGSVDGANAYLALGAPDGARRLPFVEAYMLETPATVPERLEADLVFVGYGISAPEHGHDDFAEVDVAGTIAVAVKGRPAALENTELPRGAEGNAALASRGALGLIVISEGLLSSYERFTHGALDRRIMRIPNTTPEPAFQVIQAGPPLVEALSAILGIEKSALASPGGRVFTPRRLSERIRVETPLRMVRRAGAYNVIGILDGQEGGDFVGLTAHYDHLPRWADGTVNNGADDNASGTAAVLEAARVVAAAGAPERSALVIFFGAEELDLSGSEYLTRFAPPMPIERIRAVLNADMVGRSRTPADTARVFPELSAPGEVYALTADPPTSPLRTALAAAARKHGLALDFTFGSRSFVFRWSDHYSFHKRGVPVLYLYTGHHQQYHEPTDDPDMLDWDKLARIAALIAETGHTLLNPRE
ncbi:MAG: M20/M25/M40 family metallo-hydrolase [Gemmatimonadota bacterium]